MQLDWFPSCTGGRFTVMPIDRFGAEWHVDVAETANGRGRLVYRGREFLFDTPGDAEVAARLLKSALLLIDQDR